MNDYCDNALEYLRLAFDPLRALFSYSTSLDIAGRVVNDFRMPESLRYTINAYLGLSAAQRYAGQIEWLGDVTDRVNEFLALHEQALSSPADTGLLLVLLGQTAPSHPALARAIDRIDRVLASQEGATALHMQDLAWMLWGTASIADHPKASALADGLIAAAPPGG